MQLIDEIGSLSLEERHRFRQGTRCLTVLLCTDANFLVLDTAFRDRGVNFHSDGRLDSRALLLLALETRR